MEDITGKILKLRYEYINQHLTGPTEVYITREAEKILLQEEFRKQFEAPWWFAPIRTELINGLRGYNSFYGMKIFWDSVELVVA